MHYRQASDLGGQDRAKLTADDVRDIRRLAADGVDRWTFAFKYGVTAGTITITITTRRGWRHVDDEPRES